MPAPSEFQIHAAFVRWFAGEKYGKNHSRTGDWKVYPARLPGVVSWHTPNNAKREDTEDSALEGSWLKQMGLVAGIPDYFMLWGALHAIEFKKPGGGLSAAQRALHPQLIAAGARVVTCDSLDAAKRQATEWRLTAC